MTETDALSVSFADDVATSSRANLVAEITNIWPRFAPGLPIATELMARFGKNKLEMLDDDLPRLLSESEQTGLCLNCRLPECVGTEKPGCPIRLEARRRWYGNAKGRRRLIASTGAATNGKVLES